MLRRDVLTSVCAILLILSSFNFVTLNSSGDIAATISTVSGTNVDDKFGWNVSDCGDVNGDGIDDIIVGAPGYNGDQGRAYIFFGGSGLIGDLISDSADVILEGSGAGALFGWDVSGAGDFNGDGFNDTIVGAPGNNTNTGAAYIFYGSSSLGGTITSNNANITIDGENSGDFFGSSVSDLGDVSKETPIDHVVISEVYANAVDETSPDIGEFMELYNPTSSPVLLNNWVIEDLDSHSFTLMGTIPAYGFFLIAIDNYLGSTDPTEASWPIPDFDCGYTAGSIFANSGDEIRLKDDLGFIIDTFGYGSDAEWYEGTYYPTLPNPWESYERKLGVTMPNGGNAIDTNHNSNDFSVRLAAEPQNTASPTEIPPNQSIYDDVIVGAYGRGNDKGRAYVFFGSSGDPINASSADVILTGEADNHLFGFSVSGAGDVNSDGFDDILVGAPGYDNYRGRSYIYHGSQNMRGWTQDIVFAHWDESTGAVYDIANVYAIYEKRWLAQSFTPDKDYLLTKLWLYLDNIGTTTISISLEGHSNGPDGNILAMANPKPNNPSSPMPLTWVEFEFTTPFQATAGTMYWITARATGKNTNNCWGWLQDLDSNPNYIGGYSAYVINPPATWTEEPDYDYWFKALGRLPSEIPPDITLTGGAQGDLFGWSVSDAGDIGGDSFDDVIVGAPGTANGNAYLINGSNAMKDVTVAGIVWGEEKQFTNWETGGDMEPAVYSGQFVAQSFIPQDTYLQTNLSLLIKTFGTQGTLTIKLMGSTGSSPDTIPDGVVLAQAPSISTGNVSYEWTNFEWLIPYTCTAGIEYFIVAEGTGSDTSNCWGWYGQRVGSYPDGDSAFDQGGGWTAYDADIYFRAFGSSETALPNITLQGEFPGDLFGYSVSSAGNFNGDAYDDIVVGAPGNGNGKVYIFNSSSIMPPIIQAVNANYTALGEGPLDWFGWSVSLAGDVNTTVGNFEVIVGAPFQDPGGLGDAGKAYILSMTSTPPLPPVGDLPLRINNDAEFAALAASEGWVGDGSAGNPYIIEDYNIDGGGYGYCIYIGNTTVSFIIRDSNFYNSSGNAGNYFWDSGVALYNAPNGSLINNVFENCTGNAVHIVGTTNTTITQNIILNTTGSGVYMESSTGNFIDDNTFDNNNYGLEMNTNSDSNIITNNEFTNNSEAMDLWASDNNIISNNYGDQNGIFAFLFGSCNGNEFLNNTIINSGTGIYLMSNCDGNTIQNNTITNMTWEGILIESSDSNIIEENDIQGCRDGIYTILALLNVISNNTLSNNTDNGIYLDPSSDQNTISNNTIADNGEFGILMISADFNIIIYNDIYNNTLYGINASSTTNENEIHHNNFTNNNGGDVQANDDGTDNWWNDTIGEGNLWSDYETRYVPPATSNGVVWDIPYDINGSAGAQDLFPLALYPWYQDLRIDNNSDFADTVAFFGWAGDGIAGNPYIIDGLTIDAGGLGYGIYIGNTTSHFIISNCSIENSTGNSDQYFRNSGIYLFNATNGTIDNNDIKSCGRNGINIEYSYDIFVTNNTVRYNNRSGIYTGYYGNITISDNICTFNGWSGVWLWSTSDSFITNNTCLNNSDGLTLEWTNNISIIDNVCFNNTNDGVYVMSSEFNTLTNNTCFFNEDGFYLDQSNNVTLSDNDCNNNSDDGIMVDRSEYISLYNNTCVDNDDGIYIRESENNTADGNICINNSDDGITLNNADYNTITNNTSIYNTDGIGLNNSHNNTIANNICDNNGDGIDMDFSNYNTLLNNTCNYNTGDGFDINTSSNNTFDNNDCNNNTDNGIELSYSSNNNTIRNNTLKGNNGDGIFMDMGNLGGLIENNTISENGRNGIILTYDSDNFVIIYNIISNNSDYGILILDNDCENNFIHHNGFFNNNGSGVQAYDNGSNAWNDGYPSGGNFWSDYIGVDFNSTASQDVPPPDGFGDTPYDINGLKGAQDRYPLITFPWSPPPPSGLPEISNVTALPDPQETGGFVNISCNVTDSDGVSEVWVNVTLPTGGFLNTSLNKGTGDSWFYNSLYSILGAHNYVIWAKDVAGIWNYSSGHSFTIQDTTPPMISNVQNLPDPQEAGGFVNVSCDVIDNIDISNVWVNITLPGGGYTNLSMTKGLGDEWYNNTVYGNLGVYDYVIWVNDTSNNWNSSSGHSFTIQDTTLPVISNVLDNPDPQVAGGSVNITVDVTDNAGVYDVWVNITLPSGGSQNVSMSKGTGDSWFNNTIYSILGIYDYVIWTNDTSGNWNSSSGHSFTIQDTTLPVISNVLDTPDPQETGGLVNITCDVTDTEGIFDVWVNITLPSGGYVNISLTKGAGNEWYNYSIYTTLGIYDYVIWVNDTSNNWNSSSGHSFTIQDTILPIISNVLDVPDPQEVGGSVNISCDVTDIVGISNVWVNITLPGGGYTNLSMTKGAGDEWYNNTFYVTLGVYDYVIWANDTSGTWNTSSGHSFTIQDTILPMILNVLDVPDPQEVGGSVNISCDVTDIMGIYDVWVNITSPSGSSLNISMNKGTGDTWFNNTIYSILGIYDYVIWTNDTSGNWNSSSGHSLTIQDSTLPVISNVSDNPDPQEMGGFVNITCEVTDTMGVFDVRVNISLPGGGYLNVSMTKGTGNIWYNETLYWLLGTYDYIIWTNDTSGNWNGSFVQSFSVLPGAPFDIIVISGDGQIGSVATKLTAPLVVEVRDQYGNPVPNANVWFNVTLGGGTVDIINPVVTDGNGRAQANLTVGTSIGLNTVTAEIAGGGVKQVIFIATGIPGAIYDIVIISGNGQSGVVGMQLLDPLVVEVHDQFGNRIPNSDVWFNITLGGGTVDVTNPVSTGSNGRAQANLTLGTTSGPNTLTAEIGEGSITQVIFSATGNPDEPNYIMILSGNGQSDKVDTRLAYPFVVEVTDQYGNPVPDIAVWFNTTSGNGSIDTTSPVFTDSLGRAQVNLTLGPNAGINSVTAEMSSGSTTQVTFIATGLSNKPEIIISISDVEMLEDDPPYSLFLFASAIDDVDLPKGLKWFISDIDSSLYSVSGQDTNVLVITPKPDMYGNDQVTLSVEDSDGLQDSQPLWINITPVNDKPFFFPEPPDLTITKDISYTFNYAPYLFDIDNNIGELTLASDDPDHTSVSGHLVTYLYPSSMVNKKIIVTLTLSDGIDSTSTVIQINISEDNVPILREELPNVILFEGEIKYNVFDLDDYFYDPDGDAVYFSYGYSHIIIMINENHSVDFFAHDNWFGQETVTFRARDPGAAIVEDTISVTVLPVNDPPVISDVPDLVVHYDATYYFNLTPYIFDADNSDAELSLSFMEFVNGTWLISENINVSNDNNLKMEINYSMMYLDMKIQVRIEVYDGTDSAWDIINITVSEDWPPQLIRDIPDVVFYEDEYISNHLNVHDYFTDRDDDTLFFTYGQEHIQVVIHENGSVDFYAEENWYGTENITIRATDPSGALVEDIITVTVLPVNDAPVITRIPDQEGVIGITWIFDISPYIQDVDNNITEMVIICDSPYISTVGAVLIFQYPSDVEEDTIQVTVRDPSNADATTTFNVTLTEAGIGGRNELDILQLIWIIILIIAILTTILLLYAYQRGKYEVEEVLLVYSKKGLLVSYKHKSEEVKMDRDLMTGMFTAIQDFVSDVFESDDMSGTPLKVMELGDKKVMIEHGKYTYLAAVFKGGTWRLVTKLKTTLADLEVKYKDVLEDWDGNMEALEGIDTFLEDIVTLE